MRRGLLAAALLAGACVTSTREPPDRGSPAPATREAAATTSTSFPMPEPGAPGIGDPLFPTLGNGGYDVTDYLIEMEVDPGTGAVEATTTVTATAEADLTLFNLDLVGLTVGDVRMPGVDGVGFRRDGRELVIDVPGHIRRGTSFTVEIDYRGVPDPVERGAVPYAAGWQVSRDGYYVFSQPDGAAGWFPANDHPRDAADTTLAVTVPDKLEVVSGGEAIGTAAAGGVTTWTYTLPQVAPYAIPLAIGEFERTSEESNGILHDVWYPARIAGDPRLEAFDLQDDMVAFFAARFGAYPFSRAGAVVVDDDLPAALETQTVMTYTLRSIDFGEEVIAHEISHQWFGDRVRLHRWDDIWLNEGFATFSQWLWLEHRRGTAAYDTAVERAYLLFAGGPLVEQGVDPVTAAGRAREAFPPPDHPRPGDLFNPSVYQRGGLALVALRDLVGDEALFGFLRRYVAEFGGATVTTEEALDLVETTLGREARSVVDAWALDPELPDLSSRGLEAPLD